ncbi:MAG: lipopolysaccharide heptosyltransferase II [Phycisphaerae bacterium]|nr:lipopolysaccharide heptosyltransferase II [Phycisphaerae bacterium]
MTVAVALPNWVGDAVMATPTLRALRARFPDERIVAVVRPYVRPVLEPNPWTDAYLEVNRTAAGLWDAARRLRTEKVETGVLLPNSFRSALLFFLAGVKRRVGYLRGGRNLMLTDGVPALRRGRRFTPTPQITYYLGLAELVGAPTEDRRMELFATEADEAAAAAAYAAAGLDPARTVLVCPGAAFGRSKCWPVAHWAECIHLLHDRLHLGAAVLCAPDEADLANEIVGASAGRCATLHDKGVTLASARAVVRQARAMVAVDSGLRHYAAAMDRPVVALFGPTDTRWTETWHPKEVRLQDVPDCGPCQKGICPTRTGECMDRIRPDEVVAALAEALARD